MGRFAQQQRRGSKQGPAGTPPPTIEVVIVEVQDSLHVLVSFSASVAALSFVAGDFLIVTTTGPAHATAVAHGGATELSYTIGTADQVAGGDIWILTAAPGAVKAPDSGVVI